MTEPQIEWTGPVTGWQLDRHPRLVPHAEITQTATALVHAEPDERWLIWCDSIADVEHYAQVFADRSVAAIQGSTPWEDCGRIIEQFQAGQLRTLVALISKLAVGVRLEQCARMIFVDPKPHYFREHAQAEMRCCGPQQTRTVQVYVVEGGA